MLWAFAVCGGACRGADAGGGDPDEGGTSGGTETGDTDATDDSDPDVPPDGCSQDPLVRLAGAQLPDDATGIGEVVVAAEHAYACSHDGGLTVWSITEETVELEASGLAPGGQDPGCKRLALGPDANRLVVSRGSGLDGDGYVWLYDLADPAAPVPMAGWITPLAVEGVATDGARVFVAAGSDGVVVLEDDGEGSLVEVGAFADASSDARGLRLQDDVLFVAAGKTGLRAFDVAGDQPTPLGQVGLGGLANDLKLRDGMAFVATLTGFGIVDVSDPEAPERVGGAESPGVALFVDLGDGSLFSSDWLEVRVWDPSNPVDPGVLAVERAPAPTAVSRVRGIAATGADRLLVGELGGLHLYRYDPNACASPEISLSRSVVRFDPLEGASSRTELVLVTNEGSETLDVSGIVSSDASVGADQTALMIPPGQVAPLEITLTSEAPLQGSISITSNDPDEGELELPFETAHFRADIDDPFPGFTMVDLDGNLWRARDLIGRVTLLAYFATW